MVIIFSQELVSIVLFQEWIRVFEVDQEDLCFNFEKKRMIRLPKQVQENQLYTCQSLGKGSLPRIETAEAYEIFLKKARLEQFVLNTVRQKVSESNWEAFEYGMLPYQYSTTFNGSFLNIYDDLLFNASVSITQAAIDWYKKNNITSPQVVGLHLEDHKYWGTYDPIVKLQATCTIDVPLHIFIW